uniref:C-type lectin domain-containing protein n=1 Tax=Neogobius melanostomus TaxID=47308 RepID=A0A8C6UDA8_9GOBI
MESACTALFRWNSLCILQLKQCRSRPGRADIYCCKFAVMNLQQLWAAGGAGRRREKGSELQIQCNLILYCNYRPKNHLSLFIFSENHTSEGWEYFEGGWYLGSNTKQSWNESRKFCQEKGADLIIINSIQEQEFARTTFYGVRWIGLSDLDQEGVWRWVDGSLLKISFWDPGEPNNYESSEHCGSLFSDDRIQNWNDGNCSWKCYCICEK